MARGTATRTYKPQITHDRVITEERDFSAGMQYTNTEIQSSSAKVLVNLDVDKASGALKSTPPRYCSMRPYEIDTTGYNYQHAVSGQLSVALNDALEKFVDAYVCFPTAQYNSKMPCTLANGILVVTCTDDVYEYHYITCDSEDLALDDDDAAPLSCMYVPKIVSDVCAIDTRCVMVGAEYLPNKVSMYGVFPTVFIMNGNLFMYVYADYRDSKFYRSADTDAAIAKYEGLYTVNTRTWALERVAPKDISVTTAVASGYNLLQQSPYTFNIGISATTEVQLQGLVPIDPNTNTVLLRTKANSLVKYNLIYDYPTADSTDKYYVQWKIQDNASSKDPEVIQPLKKSAEYNPGDTISISFVVPYDNFTLVCELYKQSEMLVEDEAWEASEALQSLVQKDEYHTPNKTITVTSSYIANQSKGSNVQSTPILYNVARPLGAIVWKQRCVTWGYTSGINDGVKVEGRNIVVISDANDPSYVPYPNNALIFNEDVLACTTYRDSLIVFTKRAIYKVVFDADGITPVTQLVQSGLSNNSTIIADILSDNNFVMVRTSEGYSMLCPSQYATSGIQLAPISSKLGSLLRNFSDALDGIVNAMYPTLGDYTLTAAQTYLSYGLPADGEDPVIIDGANQVFTYTDDWDYERFVENARYFVRGMMLQQIPSQNIFMDVYKVALPVMFDNRRPNALAYIDVCLCYNTNSRCWSLDVHRSSEQPAFLVDSGDEYDRWLTVADAHWYSPVQRAYHTVYEVPHATDS